LGEAWGEERGKAGRKCIKTEGEWVDRGGGRLYKRAGFLELAGGDRVLLKL
jgi:hypothetical protein